MEPTQPTSEESAQELDFLSILSPIGRDLNAQDDYVPVFNMLDTFASSLLGKTMDMHHLAVAARMEREFFTRSEIIRAFNLSERHTGLMPRPFSEHRTEGMSEIVEDYMARFHLADDDHILTTHMQGNSLHRHFSSIRNNQSDYKTNVELRLTVLRKSIFSLPAVSHLESEEEDDFI